MEFIEDNGWIKGKTQLPLEKAIKSIINEKRKIGQKIYRIIIISDGLIYPTISNPIKYAKIAKDLGIICDAIRFGKGVISGNIIKRVVEITGGSYFFINDEDDYSDVIQKISEKKKLKVSTLLSNGQDDEFDTLNKDIASPLLKIDDLTDEQKAQVNFEELKCAICHSQHCITCETGFYGCGRFCPSCLRPIHLHCAIKWSESQHKNNSNGQENFEVLRCPFCYYLLKIPITLSKEVFQASPSGEKNIVKKVSFSQEASELMTSICGHPECGIMFDSSIDNYVYKCQACENYFHTDCFLNDYVTTKKCPYCKRDSDCLE